MTGSICQLNRQHSSTAGTSTMEKGYRQKLRRCSSVDDRNSIEVMPDDHQHKEISVFKREHTTSDVDSGTEDIEQLELAFTTTQLNDNEDTFSAQCFSPNFDEGFSEQEREKQSQLILIQTDLELSKNIPDETKKDFCPDTCAAFHGEFARLISVPLSLSHDIRYYLFAQEELPVEFYKSLLFGCIKLDNAKAQFKCSNICCGHAWTSMRARISFSITDSLADPTTGFIVLKIFGQNCQKCGANADALWYIDEVCRVMRNLAEAVFEKYYPDMLNNMDLESQKPKQNNMRQTRHPNHDPTQRKGKMYAPHIKDYCEACRLGLCFL